VTEETLSPSSSEPSEKNHIFRLEYVQKMLPLAVLLLFGFALRSLSQELGPGGISGVLLSMRTLPLWAVAGALLFTLGDYLVLTFYDFLGVRNGEEPLPYRKTALASFISYALSHNSGFSFLAGSTLRLRVYGSWGISPGAVAKIAISCGITFWLGYALLGGALFLVAPLQIPEALHLPFASSRPLGFLLLLVAAFYVGIAFLPAKARLLANTYRVPVPTSGLVLAQAGVGVLDWLLASATVYVLLPDTSLVSYPFFAGLFLLAQLAGFASQVPGGIGVFESVLFLLLPEGIDRQSLLGSLLVYRGIYYIAPLLLAFVLLAVHELGQGRLRISGERTRRIGDALSLAAPSLFAAMSFLAGIFLLLTGTLPLSSMGKTSLATALPLPLLEFSHLFGSLAGMALLFLADGLRRRLDTAWLCATVLLGTGSVLSLLRGHHPFLFLLEAVLFLFFLPGRRHFSRKGSLLGNPFSPEWFVTLALALGGTMWLGFLAYRHVPYENALWWQTALHADAPRFLRAQATCTGLFVLYVLIRLFRPLRENAEGADKNISLDTIAPIVASSPRTEANLAFLGDKSFLLADSGNTFIMYGTSGKSMIALGDPVGPEDAWADLLWTFREKAERRNERPVFYQISPARLERYIDLGLQLVKLGEEGKVDLSTVSTEGSKGKRFRSALHRGERERLAFRVYPPEDVPGLLPRLREISDEWLLAKSAREKRFSLGAFDETYLRRYSVAVIETEGRAIAFANVWQSGGRAEISPDLMRYGSDAPPGIMEFLFLELMLWGKERGFRWFNLGMAPLSGLEDRRLAPFWHRLGTFVFRHGEHFYNFQGLRQYKEKFDPHWEPRYLAYPGRLSLPAVLTDVASLVAGGFKGIFMK